jgi:sporulation protein YlmC with PRC-barrel domain
MNQKVQLALLAASAALCVTTTSGAQADEKLGTIERADKIYGKTVISSDNQKVGKLNNLVLDLESGRILYAVIGADKGRVAVPPQIFNRTPSTDDDDIRVNVTRQKIESAPHFGDYDKPEELGKAELVSQVYQHFGKPAWWQGSQPVNQGSFNNVHKASKLVGMKVENVNNADMGKVENVMLDLPAGRIPYVVLSPSGRLDLGDKLFALPPDALTLSRDHDNLVSSIDKDKLTSAPHFEKGNWGQLSDPSFASRVYQYYGKQAYFGEGSLRPTGR